MFLTDKSTECYDLLSIMRVVIGSKAVKIFIKALKFLGKFSSEYIIVAKNKRLQIKIVCKNQVSLAVASFDDLFFVRYEESDDQEHNKCRVSAKVLLGALRHPNKIAACSLKLDIPNDCIYLNVTKNNDFIVKNKILLLEFDEIDDFEIPSDQSEIVCQPSVFRRVLQTSKIDELKFHFQNDLVTIQSYIDFPDEDCENVRLNYIIDTLEFTSYDIKEEKAVVVSCNDFIILLNLAQSLNMEIEIRFSDPGNPMFTKLKNDGHYTMSLIQATLPPQSYSKRNIKTVSYKEVITDYVEKRKVINDSKNTNERTFVPQVTESYLKRAINPNIEHFNIQEHVEIENDKSEQNKSSQTYLSTSTSLGYHKRKSTDEKTEIEDDLDQTKDFLRPKKRKTQSESSIHCNNSMIVLSQKELSEVQDILANIDEYCEDENDIQNQIANTSQNVQNRTPNDVEMVNAPNTENLYSENRWPLHNSYFRNTESEEISQQNYQQLRKKSTNPLDAIFGHLFKPRSRIQFGKVLVPGSDSDE